MTKGSLIVFDIDHTLFTPQAKVVVTDKNGNVQKIDAKIWAKHTPEPDEIIDYSEFRSAELFVRTSKPIWPVLEVAKKTLNNIKINGPDKALLLTARPDYDDNSKILSHFHTYGLRNIELVTAGNDAAKAGTFIAAPTLKVKVLKYWLGTGRFDNMIAYDDDKDNLKAFANLKYSFTEVSISVFLVKNGRIEPFL